jgi:hypothetical protein
VWPRARVGFERKFYTLNKVCKGMMVVHCICVASVRSRNEGKQSVKLQKSELKDLG